MVSIYVSTHSRRVHGDSYCSQQDDDLFEEAPPPQVGRQSPIRRKQPLKLTPVFFQYRETEQEGHCNK